MGLSPEECAALPRETPASSPPPSAFGRFRVVHQVGVGVLGPVYRGYDPEQDRAVAIKALPLDITPERAGELAADLGRLPTLGIEHPAAVAPLAAGADGATVYLVQEYFVAESADVALKQYGPAPVPDAVRLVGQLAGALDTAAAAGVFHGALHPRDILVAPHEVRLTGLGVAGALERAGVRAPLRRPYAAPERMGGAPVSAAADIFSLACVAFELVTGRRPSQSGDIVTAETASIEAPDAVALAEAFARALSPRADDRHPSALAFAAALKHALTGEPLATDLAIDRPRPRHAGKASQKAQASSELERIAPPSAPSLVALPGDLLLAAPPGAGATYDPSDALLKHEAQADNTVVTEAGELSAASETRGEPEPSPLASYQLADTRPAPLEPVALDRAALAPAIPEPLAVPEDESGIDTVSEAAIPEPARFDFEPRNTEPRDSEPATERAPDSAAPERPGEEAPAPAASPPEPLLARSAERPGLVPLLVGALACVLLGFLLGYLVGHGVQPAAPTAATPAAVPQPQARPSAPTTAKPAVTSAPQTPAPAGAGTARPSAATATPAAAPAKPATAPPPAPKKPEARTSTARKTPPPAKAPTKFVGSLTVVSRPAGATVMLDGRTVGTTPLTLPEVAAGSHAVRLELPGYRVWSASTQVATGQQKRVSASLERRERRPGG